MKSSDNLLMLRVSYATPPGGWKCICPGTEVEVHGGDFFDLVSNCHDTLVHLGLPSPLDLTARVQDAICRSLPANSNACKPSKPTKQKITIAAVWRFLNTLKGWFGNGMQPVSQEEADRRAVICKNCPMQVEVAGCWGCKGIGAFVQLLKKNNKTEAEPWLKTCGVCGCYNAVQVWVPKDVLDRASGDMEYPEHCWKRTPDDHAEETPTPA